MQKTETTEKTKKRELRKVTVEIVKMKSGETVEGTFTGRTTTQKVDGETGEMKSLVRLHFTRDDGNKFIVFEDGGLRNAMANSMVKEGMFIRIEKKAKSDLGRGRSVNNYDIFAESN